MGRIQKFFFIIVLFLQSLVIEGRRSPAENSHASESHNESKNYDMKNHAQAIRIMNENIPEFPQEFLKDFKNLKGLFINKCGLKIITNQNLKPFKDLQQLDLSHNKITTIKKELFKFNSNLNAINLQGNPITSIKFETFMNLTKLRNVNLDFNGISISVNKENESYENFQEALKMEFERSKLTTTSKPSSEILMFSKSVITTPKIIPTTSNSKTVKITKIFIEFEAFIKDENFLSIELKTPLYKLKSTQAANITEPPKSQTVQSSFEVPLYGVIIASSLFGILLTLYVVLLVSHCRYKKKRKLCKCEIAAAIKNRKSIGCCRENEKKFVKQSRNLGNSQSTQENNEVDGNNSNAKNYEEVQIQPQVHRPIKKTPVYENMRLDRIRVTYTEVEIGPSREGECECHYVNLKNAGKTTITKRFWKKE